MAVTTKPQRMFGGHAAASIRHGAAHVAPEHMCGNLRERDARLALRREAQALDVPISLDVKEGVP